MRQAFPPFARRLLSRPVAIIVGLTLIALLLRLWGVTFGLPYEYHIDEHFYYPYAWQMGTGDLNLPDQAHGPSLYLGLLLIAQKIAQVIVRPDLNPQQFAEALINDPWPALLAGRIVSALAGALTIPIVFALGRRYRDELTGLAAAAVMTVLFFHVRDSHFGVPDAVMVLFATTTIWLALRAYQTRRPIDFALAGFFAGQTAAAKYTSALVVVPIVLAAFAARRQLRDTLRWTVIALLGFIPGFISGYPNILINFPAFIKDISFLWIRVGGGFEGWRIVPDESGWFYLFTLYWSTGLPFMALTAIGLIGTVMRRQTLGLLLMAFPVTYFAMMSLSRGHFGRYMLPILPMLTVLVAEVCVRGLPAFLSRRSLRAPYPIAVGLALLLSVIGPNAAVSLRADWIMAQPDTRTQAKQWIETNIPAGTRIAVEWPYHTPPLSNGYEVPTNSQRDYWTDRVWGFGLADRPLAQYQTDGTQVIVSTSFVQGIPVVDGAQEANRQQFYAQLPQVFTEIARFNPTCDGREPSFEFDSIYGPAIDLWTLCYAGPRITLYQVRPK